jgi:hypothetical protein
MADCTADGMRIVALGGGSGKACQVKHVTELAEPDPFAAA